MIKLYRHNIQPGREGWVYLIYAEGTQRYKIGRSVNPVTRHQVLQKQSPYPLQIIECFYTLDTVTDEAKIHKLLVERGILKRLGEWFESPDEISVRQITANFFSWTNDCFEKDALLIFKHLGADCTNYKLQSALANLVEITLPKQRHKLFWQIVEKTIPEEISTVNLYYSLDNPTEYIAGMLQGAALMLYELEGAIIE